MTGLLQQLYPTTYRPPCQHFITRWSQDPFSLGAYSFPAVGSKEGDNAACAAPEGLLHFAGEHCSSKHYGTMHGAYQSGMDAARRLLQVL